MFNLRSRLPKWSILEVNLLSIRPTGNAQGFLQKEGLLGPLDDYLLQNFNNGTPLEIGIPPRRLNSTVEGRKLFIGRKSEEIICLYRSIKSFIVFAVKLHFAFLYSGIFWHYRVINTYLAS